MRLTAPRRSSMDTLRVFTISKLGWIRAQQARLRMQERETPREYIDRESHYVWGRRYLLSVVEANAPASIELTPRRMFLRVRPGGDQEKRRAVVEAWYRSQIKAAVPGLLERWETQLGVSVARFFVQRMKTTWGTCNARARTIRLNTELAKKPPECLEYIVVHELAHLLVPRHNARFVTLMDRVLPSWRFQRQALNRLPVPEERHLGCRVR